MFFHKLWTLLLLLLAVNCPTSWEQPWISPSPRLLTSPNGSSLPELPGEDVEAVNALFKLWKKSMLLTSTFNFSSTSCNSLPAITCNCPSTICRVTRIDLSAKDLKGRIPAEIGKLSYLTYLDLSRNNLEGTIPPEIGKLSYLRYLKLRVNQLSGSIPQSFQNLSQLSHLALDSNNLEGQLPPFISQMKSLKNLYLNNNWFNGSIPYEFGVLPFLGELSLDNNFLSGYIPYQLGNISSLIRLYCRDNEISGYLPEHLGNLSNLEVLSLENNQLTGPLPSSLGKLKRLGTFVIQGNNFNGIIPDFIANWQELVYLVLVGNNFEGPLPAANISKLRKLSYLFINNQAAGGAGDSLLSEISKIQSLEALYLSNCSLSGSIPDKIWQLPKLFLLDLSFNNLSGRIPTDVKSPFEYIFLRGNQLNESLPGWLLNLDDAYVDVSENRFTNKTIASNATNPYLNLFACCSNITNGEKWQEAGYYCTDEKRKYDGLYINCGGDATPINESNYDADLQIYGGSNFFLSESKAWGYSSMGTNMYIEDQFILKKNCNILMADAPLYETARVSPSSLKYFGFCLMKGNYSVKLHFAEIGWEETIGNSTKSRRVFNVDIQGQHKLTDFNIEQKAGGVNKDHTEEFYVYLNGSERLQIHLYTSGKGTTYQFNYGPLISAISVSRVVEKHKKLSSGSIAAISGSVPVFVMLVLATLWKLGWLGGKKANDQELRGIELFPGGIFSFKQIKAATNNFNPENKIGEGGFGAVFKGKLPNGTQVAVKQLSKKSKQGAREFVNEIGTIYALQHPNLVRIMGCCTEEKQLLLVYEYMENGSLDSALFGPEEIKSRLSWQVRVKICLGLAKGLAYLHEEGKLRFIHRDIKPTNILLDKDFNAKISDFGFALLSEEQTTRVITRIAGTTGYMAPEYVQGFVTAKADVYSFGIVTLEIVSGKNISTFRPKDQTIYLLDTAYEYLREGNLIALVDSSLGSDYNYNEALKILHLAMQCVSPAPKQRPSMSEVVQILEGKKKIKTTSFNVSFPMDDSTISKPIIASQLTESDITSAEEASSAAVSHSNNPEIDESNISDD